VGAPADEYVADFVSEVPKADVLTLRWIAKRDLPADSGSTTLPADMVIKDAIPTVMAATGPVQVVDGGTGIGSVGRDEILALIAKHEAA
jgi:glycine betaine/proline transport system ATP-binding protein